MIYHRNEAGELCTRVQSRFFSKIARDKATIEASFLGCGEAPAPEQLAALEDFLAKEESLWGLAVKKLIQLHKKFVKTSPYDDEDEVMQPIKSEEGLLGFLGDVYWAVHSNVKDAKGVRIGVGIGACEWEEEHGLSLTFQGGKIIRTGFQEEADSDVSNEECDEGLAALMVEYKAQLKPLTWELVESVKASSEFLKHGGGEFGVPDWQAILAAELEWRLVRGHEEITDDDYRMMSADAVIASQRKPTVGVSVMVNSLESTINFTQFQMQDSSTLRGILRMWSADTRKDKPTTIAQLKQSMTRKGEIDQAVCDELKGLIAQGKTSISEYAYRRIFLRFYAQKETSRMQG